MALAIGKRDTARVGDLLDREWEDKDDLAAALLELAFEIYEAKAKWVVVGQLKDRNGRAARATTEERIEPVKPWKGVPFVYPPERKAADPTKMALGPYGTYGQAHDAALEATVSRPTGETFRAWPIQMFHGTPFQFYGERKKEFDKAKQTDANRTSSERLVLINEWLTLEQLGHTENEKRLEPCWFCGTDLPDPDVFDTPND